MPLRGYHFRCPPRPRGRAAPLRRNVASKPRHAAPARDRRNSRHKVQVPLRTLLAGHRTDDAPEIRMLTILIMSQETLSRAWEVLQDAYQAQMEGDYDCAVELYQSSLDLYPTAEAHTFLGWTCHFQGRLDDAISECKRAIEIDPEFGNPYNDIGAYLIEKNRFDEAIPWLERAVEAARYEPRHFPTTIWAAPTSAKKCTPKPSTASSKRSRSSRATP